MIERIIDELEFAKKKRKNCVLGYVECGWLISELKEKDKEIEKIKNIVNELENLIYNNEDYLSDGFLNSFDKIIGNGSDKE